jgi:hypothetical protein
MQIPEVVTKLGVPAHRWFNLCKENVRKREELSWQRDQLSDVDYHNKMNDLLYHTQFLIDYPPIGMSEMEAAAVLQMYSYKVYLQ